MAEALSSCERRNGEPRPLPPTADPKPPLEAQPIALLLLLREPAARQDGAQGTATAPARNNGNLGYAGAAFPPP